MDWAEKLIKESGLSPDTTFGDIISHDEVLDVLAAALRSAFHGDLVKAMEFANSDPDNVLPIITNLAFVLGYLKGLKGNHLSPIGESYATN